ncbi:aminotransferase class III-fold pyridoxal phosphate-dependent enzyme [Bosea sp. CCNWLW174]|uniref:aminotransferase class III-fold pyridoxal phosphate-dependent enzyme n=1 Tax=unclassified Bosea (in: a-proteobacteria) TaxID=2653178 RepID=UPI0030151EC8
MTAHALAPESRRDNAPDAFWMPFTPMRAFRQAPLLFERAEGMHYITPNGRRVLDGMAGLWCVNAGHGQAKITEAIRAAAGRLDFVSSFKMSHPDAQAYAARLCDFAPEGIDHVFFVNSGSEAVDTALKIARAYHQARGQAGRTKLIGRAKGYHGMGWGGLSVSGIGRHKAAFGPLLPDVAHLPLPYDRATMAFSRGRPEGGLVEAEALETLLQIHDPATVAAVIVEPVTGSGGVYPPPKGYLECLRAICDRHGILLIFDEVITGFGRLGSPFAAQAYGVRPDLMSCAKGMTNGAVPMGGVLVAGHVYEAFMAGPPEAIELFHGYTYSAHPLACAAGLATLDVFAEQDILGSLAKVLPLWEERAHRLKGAAHVVDIRTAGLLCAIDLAPRPGADGARGGEANALCLDAGVLVRNAGDTLVLSPPLVIAPAQIEEIFTTIERALGRIG